MSSTDDGMVAFQEAELKRLKAAATRSNDGGLAFPRPNSSGGWEGYPAQDGMSLRDWFAGQALAGAAPEVGSQATPTNIARLCYDMADAMLAARDASAKAEGDAP